jgi:hypothetical protein
MSRDRPATSMACSTAANTRRGYRSDWRQFEI